MKILKYKFETLKLNYKFTLVILAFVMIPMLVFSNIMFWNMEESAIQELVLENKNAMTEQYSEAKKTVEMCNMSTQTFLNNQELKTFLQRLNDDDEISVMEYLEFSKKNISMLERLVNSNPYLYQIRVYANNENFPEMVPILYHRSRLKNTLWGESYVSGKWQFDYPDSIQPNSMNGSRHLMSLVSTISNDDGDAIGVVEVAVSMEEIFPVIFQSNESKWASLIDGDKMVCCESNGKESLWCRYSDELLEKIEKMEGGQQIRTKIGGKQVILAVWPMNEFSARYVQAINIQSGIDEINGRKLAVTILLILIFAVLAIVINRIVKRLLNKFYETLKVIRLVQKNNLDVRVEHTGSDEMGELGTQINKMLDRMKKMMDDSIQREVLVKNTEIKALQNQINAHFIYNVLECIKMMAEINSEFEISDAVTALGELLRYSMKWVSGNVTIRQEMDYIQNYITLMNLRYDFTINLAVRIPDYIYEQEIPKMSLQPIVENAICHGIEELDEDATIYIKVIEQGSDYEIEITDSGKGMSEETLENLYKKLRGETSENSGSGNGIGLKNVQDRIKMQFGDAYGLRFATKEECYTKVIVKLPIIKKYSEDRTVSEGL